MSLTWFYAGLTIGGGLGIIVAALLAANGRDPLEQAILHQAHNVAHAWRDTDRVGALVEVELELLAERVQVLEEELAVSSL